MAILKLLIFFLIIIFPFGQLTRLPLSIPEINLYLQDIIIGGLVVFWFVWHHLKKIPFVKPPLTKPILLFFGIAFFSLFVNLSRLSQGEMLVSSFYLLRWIFYAGIYFVVSEMVRHQNVLISRLRWGLIGAGTMAGLFGLVQYFLYPDLSNLVYLGWDPHRFRVFATFFDPGFLGIILVLTLILIVDIVWRAEVARRNFLRYKKYSFSFLKNLAGSPRAILYVCFFLSYSALALTYSRSSYLAYLVGMGIIAWIKKSAKFFLVVVLVEVLTILLLPRPPGSEGVRLEREETVWGRVKNWQQSLVIFMDKPLLGVGFNTYRYAQRDNGFLDKSNWQETHAGAGADSSLLFVLATTGILGFLVYLLLLYDILIYHIQKKSLVVLASMSALLVGSWFSNSLFYPWIMVWLWVLLGSSG